MIYIAVQLIQIFSAYGSTVVQEVLADLKTLRVKAVDRYLQLEAKMEGKECNKFVGRGLSLLFDGADFKGCSCEKPN